MASREVIRHTSGLEEGAGDSRGRSGRKAAGQECRSEHYYTCRLLIPINDLFHRSGSAEKRFFLLYGGTILDNELFDTPPSPSFFLIIEDDSAVLISMLHSTAMP